MDTIQLGDMQVTRFMLGSNPFSGYSHQSPETDLQMKRWFTVQRIKDTLREAESLGVNTLMARADHHMGRLLLEHWDEGGKIQWFAQTCPEIGPTEHGARQAIAGGANACHIHGGVMDHLLAQGNLDEVPRAIEIIREAGLLAGIAGHDPEVFRWAEANLAVDYYMCSYYNSMRRDRHPEHVSGATEWFHGEDRKVMTELIQTLSKPVIHYKVMAAGRNDPAQAFAYVAKNLRPQDAVCVGVYPEHHPGMLRENVELFESSLADMPLFQNQ